MSYKLFNSISMQQVISVSVDIQFPSFFPWYFNVVLVLLIA